MEGGFPSDAVLSKVQIAYSCVFCNHQITTRDCIEPSFTTVFIQSKRKYVYFRTLPVITGTVRNAALLRHFENLAKQSRDTKISLRHQ
ncbi:unnamed protein product [Acanthoscelides obtectus]|uniref:Uncharacterized protein n=1 Tax=Acanthoscelides obtectus TaxID=200917 RepID=A0A9P0M6L7_ACAOB|nr:unnamed protein product [Acanthoscelides obtectus]CAH2007414.1 unnamed protein product [Acanthoscelides obtectus]CAK1630020.1 hypothetical protein AOBTE_LOCUS6106 [Acanthoscelides obtectus]CAK1671075.1 hypothetical protein AOBTE_LOCUS28039 [Acanthoscelides obtectus]